MEVGLFYLRTQLLHCVEKNVFFSKMKFPSVIYSRKLHTKAFLSTMQLVSFVALAAVAPRSGNTASITAEMSECLAIVS